MHSSSDLVLFPIEDGGTRGIQTRVHAPCQNSLHIRHQVLLYSIIRGILDLVLVRCELAYI